MEMTRLGNGHLSYRAFDRPGVRHPMAIFLAGVATFWLIGLFRLELR